MCDDILVHIHSGQKTTQIQTPGVWTRVKYLLKQLNGSQRGMLCTRYCLCRSEFEANDGGYAKALGWAKFGVKTCENGRLALEDNDTLRSTFFLEHLMLLKNQLGKLYRQQAQTDMALQMFSQVMDIINDIQNKAFEPDNNYDVIRVFTVNSMAVCYYERNRSDQDLKQALIYYKDAYDTYQRLQYYFGTVNELLNCAAVYRLLALNVLELCEGFEACEICAEQFRREFKESLIPALSHRNENTDFEDGLKKELAPGLAVYQGYVYNARCCLEAIEGILNKGVKISKKLLKDFYMYHYELDIVRSRHPSAAPDQVREILEEAGAWLEKSIEIAKKEDYKTDRCRQERYQGVLYRKMAMLTEGGEQKAYLRRAIEILEAAVKHSDTYALRTSLYYARMELALACYYYGNAQRACHIIRTMENEVDGCSQDSVRKRYAAVRSMIGYTDKIN